MQTKLRFMRSMADTNLTLKFSLCTGWLTHTKLRPFLLGALLKNKTLNDFYYEKLVQFHETDVMGIAHHSNHLKWMEETRMAWLIEKNLLALHSPHQDYTLAVLESYLSYRKPCLLGEKIQVYLKLYTDKLKFWFYYGIYSKNELCAYGHTLHIGVDKNMKVIKPPQGLIDPIKENTAWTETWPSNL